MTDVRPEPPDYSPERSSTAPPPRLESGAAESSLRLPSSTAESSLRLRSSAAESSLRLPSGAEGSSDAAGSTEAVVELLGMLAYGELLAFERMAADARLAPDLRRRAVLCEMAAAEITNYRRLAARIGELGADPEAAMAPYVAPLQAYHDQTEPRDWLEALTKAYVGDSIADDFFREVAAFLGDRDRDRKLVLEVLHDSRYGEFAAKEIRSAIDDDPKLANRLSMWARRLVGEGLSQAQRVAANRPALAMLIAIGSGDQEGVQALLKRLTQAHGARMTAAGLNN